MGEEGDFERLEHELAEARAQLLARNEVLTAIGHTGGDLDSMLDTVVASARTLSHADVAQIHFLDGSTYRLAAAVGHSAEYQAFVAEHGLVLDEESLIGRVGVTRRAHQIEDVLTDPEYRRLDLQQIAGYRTILGVPMFLDGEITGVMSAWRTRVQPFTDREADVLTSFAAQALIAIRVVDLMNQLERRQDELANKVEQLEALGQIGQAVSSSLDEDEVLAAILTHAVALSAADGGFVFEYDDQAQEFVVRAEFGTGAGRRLLRDVPVGLRESVIGRAVADRRLHQVADLGNEPPDPHLSRLTDAGWRSLVAVPIMRDDRLVGALKVGRTRPGDFSPETCDLLETFAGQSAMAIVNARLYRELERRGVELEVASRHKSEFLASMSHELRTPLNAVIGFSEVLLEKMFGDLTERQEEYVRDIADSGKHLLALLNDILDLSKVEAGRMDLQRTQLSVPVALDYCMSMVRERAASRGVTIDLRIGEEVDVVAVDELRFKQVVLNLLSNAVKFTTSRIELEADCDDELLTVSVTDDGQGVPVDERERIFEAFQQGGRGLSKEEGTGLGLTLSRRIVELHGGRLVVESEPGAGSRFTFTIPLRAQLASEEASPEVAAPHPDVPTIVIVEDDRRSLELLSLYITDAGAEVAVAHDGHSGLELVRRRQPAAVVLDIRLPDLDGWDLLALLKADQATASIPVVIVSMVDERAKGLGLGAAEYLVKPASREQVRAALSRVDALPRSSSIVENVR